MFTNFGSANNEKKTYKSFNFETTVKHKRIEQKKKIIACIWKTIFFKSL